MAEKKCDNCPLSGDWSESDCELCEDGAEMGVMDAATVDGERVW